MEHSTCWLPPSALQSRLEEHLRNNAIPNNLHGLYQKWLRYYLDFCQKYHVPPKHEKSLPPFIQKLQEKQQSKARQEQAVRAITLYYAILKKNGHFLPLLQSRHLRTSERFWNVLAFLPGLLLSPRAIRAGFFLNHEPAIRARGPKCA
jgi:hypothetical protein